MISVSNREWGERKFNENLVNKCSQDNNFSLILSKLIVTRNFIDDEIYTINNSKNVNFSNVFKFNEDFNKSIDLVIKNIKNKSKICILGDYDVDGVMQWLNGTIAFMIKPVKLKVQHKEFRKIQSNFHVLWSRWVQV